MLTYDVTCPKFLDLCHSNQFSVLVNKIKSLPEREEPPGREGATREEEKASVL